MSDLDEDPPTVPLTGGRVTYFNDGTRWRLCTVLTENREGLFSVELLPAHDPDAGYRYNVSRADIKWSEDPDGLLCYEDHDHDVLHKGVCEMCGSTQVHIVKHVLGGVERIKGMNPVDAARLTVRTQSAHLFDGVMLDLFSASAVVQIYDAVNDKNKARLRAMSLPEAVTFCFRLIERLNGKS